MAARATQLWGGVPPRSVHVQHSGDAASVVEFRRSHAEEVALNASRVYFDGATGEEIQRFEAPPIIAFQRWLVGLHFVQFRHGWLRFLYFAAGLSGCVLVHTGFAYWVEKRRGRHRRLGLAGTRIVSALATGSVTGIVASTLVFFAANRLIPSGAAWGFLERDQLEMLAFYVAWGATFVHAFVRGQRSAGEQWWAIAVLASLAPTLNALTTGDHPLRSLSEGRYAVLGMDLFLVALAGASGALALRAGSQQSSVGRRSERGSGKLEYAAGAPRA